MQRTKNLNYEKKKNVKNKKKKENTPSSEFY